MAEPPIVTGISPKEGPPGTRVTIRGESLGRTPEDLIGLTICGVDCLLSAEWQAPNKIVARTGPVKGRGDVIVTTRSGGRGTCTIQFRSFFESISPLKESAFWMDESHLISNAWGRKHPTVPSQYQPDNPLGLNDEGNVKKFSEDELHEHFPEGSGTLSLDNFVPTWFLVENHYGATFNDLKAGLNHLKRKVNSQKEGKLSFLKANVGAVLDQLDTLRNLQESILKDKTASASGTLLSTDKIERAIVLSKSEADSLFKDVLGRRDRADATRNALGVLQRFKFLFHLPCTIERNIQKGDYDVVINDYARARSLFATTEVQVFRKVYQEVEQRITNFRDMLYSRLQDLPMPIEKQKKLICYLVNLETSGDPGWDCITFQQDYIVEVLLNCKQVHLEEESCIIESLSQSKTSGKSSGLLSASRGLKERRSSNVGRAADLRHDRPPHRILFVEALCSLTIQEFPNLWKLGQAFFAGDFDIKDVDPSRVNGFKALVSQVMHVFCRLVRDALLLPVSNDDGSSFRRMMKNAGQTKSTIDQHWSDLTKEAAKIWLPHSVQQIRHFYSALIELDLNNDILLLIQNLLFDLRISCMKSMFSRAQEEVRNLHLRETWVINMDSEHGSITQLPLVYENSVLKTIQLVREGILQVGSRETDLLGNVSAEKEVVALWRELLLGFPRSLKQLAIMVTEAQCSVSTNNTSGHLHTAIKSPLANSPENGSTTSDRLGSVELGDGNCGQEKMLLVILGNCTFTKKSILPRLLESFQKHGYPANESVGQEALYNFEQLDHFLFNSYMELKCDPVVGAIEQGVYAGRFDWSMCPRLLGVRPYIKEILTGIVAVHSEVYSVLPSVVHRSILHMIEAVSDEIARLFSCIERYGHYGNLQARVDIEALKLAFGSYLRESESNTLKEVLDSIPSLKNSRDNRVVDEELIDFQRKMKFYLMCFKLEQKGV